MTPGVQEASYLIPDGGTWRRQFTARRETDSRKAITRALAEYLRGVKAEGFTDREILFKKVYAEPAEVEETAVYPSAVVHAVEAGKFAAESERMKPSVVDTRRLPAPDGRLVVITSEYVLTVAVEVWAATIRDRTALCAMLEDVFNPVIEMGGFRLVCPHYFGASAEFLLDTSEHQDAEDDDKRGWRKALFVLNARIPVIRLVDPGRPLVVRNVLSAVG